jgi:integrase
MSVRKREWTTRKGETKTAWVVDYSTPEGGRHLRTFERKKDADAFAQQTGVDVRAGTHTPLSKSKTVREAGAAWLEDVEKVNKCEQSTVRFYKAHLDHHILPRLGNIKLARLTTATVTHFRDSLLKGDAELKRPPISHALARKVLTSLKSLVNHAMEHGSVAQNTALPVSIKDNSRHDHILEVGVDIPTPDEVRVLLNAFSPRWRPLFMTLAFTGLRSSEIRALRWHDVDFDKGELQVRQRIDRFHVVGSPKSKAGRRTLPLSAMLINTLREWKLRGPKSDDNLVFPTVNGKHDHHQNLVRVLLSALRRAKLRDDDGALKYTGLHALRHFYASWCINPRERGGLGLSPKEVQEHMGHAKITITMDIYGHLFPRDTEQTAKAMDDSMRALLA